MALNKYAILTGGRYGSFRSDEVRTVEEISRNPSILPQKPGRSPTTVVFTRTGGNRKKRKRDAASLDRFASWADVRIRES